MPWWAIPGVSELDPSSRAKGSTGYRKAFFKAGSSTTCAFLLRLQPKSSSVTNSSASVTIGMSITTAAVMLTSSAPDIIRGFLTPPYIALSSALACRVFRTIILGNFDAHEVLNTQKIGDIMRSVKTAEYKPEFSFRSETSETETESMQTRSRLGSDSTLKAVDSRVSDEEPVPRGLDAV